LILEEKPSRAREQKSKESIDLMLLGISKGVYFIQVNDGEKSSVKKLIVE
jgi:hypothetical protein